MKELERLLCLGAALREEPQRMMRLVSEFVQVRERDGQTRPLVANAVQRQFEANRGRHNIVLKARQMGITTWVAACFFLRTITARGVLTVQVAQDREAAEGIFRMVQRMWENLPAELRRGPLRRSRANVGQMVFPALDSEFRIFSAADPSAGRGLSIQNLHCSEVSRWPGDAAATLAGLRAALVRDGELVLESTPNGASGAFYEEWLRGGESGAIAHGQLVRHFFPWWMEPSYTREGDAVDELSKQEASLVRDHQLTPGQLRFRRELERSFHTLRSQEYAEDAETCFRASGSCCFHVASVEQRMSQVQAAPTLRRNGALRIWMPPVANRKYIVAADTAGGGSEGDFAAAQVIDLATGMQCAELQERLPPMDLAAACAELAREYNQALLAVERNNHGAAVLAYLHTLEHYTPLYRQRGSDGWLTTSVSKPEMIARLGALLVERPEGFHSRRLLGECRSYQRGASGTTGAASGAHDDLVMAMALAHAVRAEMLQT